VPQDEAQRILSSAGFRIGTITPEESDVIAENAVIRTDPGAGEQVPQDTTINLVVSGGPRQVAVPSIVIGQTEAEARQLLENDPYRFVVTTTAEESDTVAPGLVIRTNPAAQSLLAIGGRLQLFVSSGPPAVDVPNVVGESESSARGRLGQFDVSVSYQDLPAGDGNNGLVLSQSVAGGQQAAAGSAIQLVVGRAAAATTTVAPTTAAPTTTTVAPTSDAPP
jgi:serine/threonine-protein kinase